LIGEEQHEYMPSSAMAAAALWCVSFEFRRAPTRDWTLVRQGKVGAADGRFGVGGMEQGDLGHA
jgi:hypothetical protein